MQSRPSLHVSIDSVAALRQIRLPDYPDPVEFALAALRAGANGVDFSVFRDRRGMQDHDLQSLSSINPSVVGVMIAPRSDLVALVAESGVGRCILSPDARNDHSPGGGLDCVALKDEINEAVRCLSPLSVRLAAFIDPDKQMIDTLAKIGVEIIELNCLAYSLAANSRSVEKRIDEIRANAMHAVSLGLLVSARGGLNASNIGLIASIREISEVHVGHALVAQALFDGVERSIEQFNTLVGENSRQ